MSNKCQHFADILFKVLGYASESCHPFPGCPFLLVKCDTGHGWGGAVALSEQYEWGGAWRGEFEFGRVWGGRRQCTAHVPVLRVTSRRRSRYPQLAALPPSLGPSSAAQASGQLAPVPASFARPGSSSKRGGLVPAAAAAARVVGVARFILELRPTVRVLELHTLTCPISQPRPHQFYPRGLHPDIGVVDPIVDGPEVP
ncbi:hypothetical protein K438DRAFT_1766504 [Mycena galopus ATCC 62051]|nr:hypothetical protein K438DRAFT_1766504 [Mycena galopus ATCC 62051]